MRDRDYSQAVEFLESFFAGTEHAVEIRALANDRGGGSKPLFASIDSALIHDHCRAWDKLGWGVFFGCCTRLKGRPTGARADLAELVALWCDVDSYKQAGLTKEEVVAALKSSPIPPTVIVDSGGGIHAYWLLREPMDVRLPEDGPDTIKEEIDAALRQLSGVFAGDPAVCEITRVLRLPGTHNTKTGELRAVTILDASGPRYELSDLQDTLDWLGPVLRAPEAAQKPLESVNPFTDFAARYGFKAPIDVEQRLAAMDYEAAGDAGIHQTQLQVSASLVSQGVDEEQIVQILIEATQRAAGIYGGKWNWKREERAIRQMVASARAKFAKADAAKPRPTVREIRTVDQTANVPADVVNLADERKARQKGDAKAGVDLIRRTGEAVIGGWRQQYGPIAVVAGQPYTYAGGIWTAWGKPEEHALKVAIQRVLAVGQIEPKTQLLNAVARYVVEHPSLLREGVAWDATGLVVCLDGVIHPLTREVLPHSEEHWATARAEVRIADMQQGCPRFLEFLTNCFTDLMEADRLAVIDTIGEWFGAAMVRNKPRELRKALWLFGESRTGKTRIAEVLRLLVGEPVSSIKLRALEKNFGASALIGKRAWIADDAIGSNDEVDDAQFKVIVTGEAFSVDVKNRDHATLRLEIPVLLTSNSLPRVRDQSDAVYNRSILAHLRVVRTEEETAGTVPIEEIVREHELSGVFSWALDGWARLWKRGRFSPPASMREAATEFKAANNVVDSWAKESLAAASEYMIDRRDAYASFKGWYIAEFGENAKVPSPKFMMMTLRQCMTIGDHKQVGNRYITGIKMTDDGLIYRKESGHEVGITPGSGCDPKEVNRPVPYEAAAQEKPSYQTAKGKEPRF